MKQQISKTDVYQQITNYVIENLEKGVAIWRKPWGNQAGVVVNYPRNLSTGRYYMGWNRSYLQWIGQVNNFSTPYWLTFRQAQALGGNIRKGGHGYPIVKWVLSEKTGRRENKVTGEQEEVTDTRLHPVTHIVFNIDQTENIEHPKAEAVILNTEQRITQCEQVVAGMPKAPAIQHGGDRACYIRVLDRIWMPDLGSFDSPEAYYSTLFHELIHSTGHEQRLNRKELIEHDGFRGKNYSREELTAEMGAAFLCGITGIEQKTIDNSTAYLSGWLTSFRDDKRMILSAASKAQAAADFILRSSESAPTDGDKSESVRTTVAV
jgi:antirestriction protein ArdC